MDFSYVEETVLKEIGDKERDILESRTVTLYLSGPMTGIKDFNFPAFNYATKKLREKGYNVINPAELGADTSKPWEYYIRRDIELLLKADAVAVLNGWEKSKGATLEVFIAQQLGMPVYDADTMETVESKLELSVKLKTEESVLEEAKRLVHGSRQEDYGHPIDDFTRTGRMWGAILGIPDIDPRIVALMMACVKISREVNKPKRDNRVDLAGYAETCEMVAAKQGV